MQQFPFRLLKMCAATRHTDCLERRTVAQEIVQGTVHSLERNVYKVKQKYLAEFQYSERTGKLSAKLEAVLMGPKTLWNCDVRENERINKMIALLRERSPNISDELQSARVCLKHYLGQVTLDCKLNKSKWSSYREAVQSLQSVCMSSWDSKEEVTADQYRFSPPAAVPNLISGTAQINKEIYLLNPELKPHAGAKHTWATLYNSMWNKRLNDASKPFNEASESCCDNDRHASKSAPFSKAGLDIVGICFGVRNPMETRSSFKVFISVEKVRTTHRMVECTLNTHTRTASVMLPLSFKSSVDIIGSFFDDVVFADKTVCMFKVALLSWGDRDAGSLVVAQVSKVEAMFHLKKPGEKSVEKLRELSGEKADSRGKSESKVSKGKDMPTASDSGDVEQSTGFEADLKEGLDLLAADAKELAREDPTGPMLDAEVDASSSKDSDSTAHMLEQAASVISKLQLLPDEIECQEEDLERSYELETGDAEARKLESAAAKEYFEAGGQHHPSTADVECYEQDGLDPEEAVVESALNPEQCLGNTRTEPEQDLPESCCLSEIRNRGVQCSLFLGVATRVTVTSVFT